jgi:hypothetical protein
MPASFQRFLTAILPGLAASAVTAAEPPAFGYAVIRDDPVIAQRLRAGIEERFATLHVVLRDRLATAKLVIYANRDSNGTRNTEGMSVAVAMCRT